MNRLFNLHPEYTEIQYRIDMAKEMENKGHNQEASGWYRLLSSSLYRYGFRWEYFI